MTVPFETFIIFVLFLLCCSFWYSAEEECLWANCLVPRLRFIVQLGSHPSLAYILFRSTWQIAFVVLTVIASRFLLWINNKVYKIIFLYVLIYHIYSLNLLMSNIRFLIWENPDTVGLTPILWQFIILLIHCWIRFANILFKMFVSVSTKCGKSFKLFCTILFQSWHHIKGERYIEI